MDFLIWLRKRSTLTQILKYFNKKGLLFVVANIKQAHNDSLLTWPAGCINGVAPTCLSRENRSVAFALLLEETFLMKAEPEATFSNILNSFEHRFHQDFCRLACDPYPDRQLVLLDTVCCAAQVLLHFYSFWIYTMCCYCLCCLSLLLVLLLESQLLRHCCGSSIFGKNQSD